MMNLQKWLSGIVFSFLSLIVFSPNINAGTYWAYRGKIGYSFSTPYKIAIDTSSNVYVLEDGSFGVTKFTSAGSVLCSTGTQGTGGDNGGGIAVDTSGQFFYIANRVKQKVQKFNSSNCTWAADIANWGGCTPAAPDGMLCAPTAIAVDSSGNIYVADGGAGETPYRVQKFSPTGTYDSKWTPTAGIQNMAYEGGYLYATQGQAATVKYSLSGALQSQFGTYGTGDGQIYDNEQLAVNASNIFKADGWGSRAQIFDKNGNFVFKIGMIGQPDDLGEGEFTNATGIGIDGNNILYVADQSGSGWVQKFSTTAYQTPIKIDEATTGQGVVREPSMASDNNGILNITYYGKGGDLKYAKWNGALWSLSTIETGIAPDSPVIAIDAQANSHIAYSNPYSNSTKYAKWNGVSWSTSTIDTSAGSQRYNAIAVDGAGNPHIAYGEGAIKYARHDGVSWSTYTVGNVNGMLPQIALSSKGDPYVAYWDLSTKEVKLATWTGTGFNSIAVAAMEGGSFNFALDGDNRPQVVYTEKGVNPSNLWYIRQDGATWTSPELIVPGLFNVKSFQLDGNGVPHVFYSALGKGLLHAYKSGASWVSEIVDATTYAGSNGASNVFDSSGRQQIVYGYAGPGDSYYNTRLLFSQWTGSGYPQTMGGNSRGRLQMPTSFQGVRSGTDINWTWGDNSSNETGFRLYGSTNSNGPFSLIADTNLLTPGSVSFGETSLTTGATYYRYISAVNQGGSVTSGLSGVYIPNPAPTVASIAPNSGYNYVGVNITNLAGTGFISGAAVKLAKSGQPDINATNTNVVSATQITCTLPLTTSTVAGAWNVVVTNPDAQTGTLSGGFTVAADVTAPTGAPSVPDAGALYSTTGDVTFNWTIGTSSDPESGIAGYDLQVGTNPATNDASVFNNDVGNVLAKILNGLAEGAYYARVRAKNAYNLAGSYSSWSGPVKVDWTAPLPNPPAAGSLQVYVSSITWNAAAASDTNSGLHAQAYSFDAGMTWQAGASSTTTGLQPDTLYSKTLRYRDAAGNITTGLAVSTYTLAAVPTAVAFSNLATTGFTVGWNQNGNPGGTTYAAEISTYSNFQPLAASSVTANTQAGFTGLEVSVRYYARVKAVNRNNVSTAYAAAASTYTLANPPAATQAAGVSSGVVTLAWSGNGNPVSTVYRVARSLDNSSYAVLAATYSSPAAIPALGPETTNYFKVSAENGDGAATAYDAAVSTFVPDYTPPTGAPSVPADGGAFISSTTITFNWTIGNSADPETGVAGYYLEVGTNTATNDKSVFDGDVGAVVAKQLTGLTEGRTYFARVKAKNGRGLYGSNTAWSDGITVDTTPPTAPAVTSLSHPSPAVIYFSTTAQFGLSSSVDLVSGVAGYYYRIDQSSTTVPGGGDTYLTGSSTQTTVALAAGTWYFHAAARDLAGNVGLAGQAGHYELHIGSAIDPARDSVFDSGDGANKVVVNITSGAVSAAASVVIAAKQAAAVPPEPRDTTTKDVGVYKEIGLSAGTIQPGKTVTISIAYEAWQVAGLDEDSLRLAHYNEAAGRWEILYDSVVDKVKRTVTAIVGHFSLFKIVAYTPQAGALANVSNYPNPFTAGRGGQTKIHYSLKADSGVELKLYDLLGRLVWHKSIRAGEAGGLVGVNDVAWDGRNDRGSYVGAGAYICVVKAGGESGKVKVAVK